MRLLFLKLWVLFIKVLKKSFKIYIVTDLIKQVSQLLRAELEELVDVARATMEPIKPYDEEW